MPDTEPHVYVEQALQVAAVRWLSNNRGYAERYSDDQAIGDRFDSIGTMEGRVVLIEVKPTVHAGQVRHAPDRPGTLESKIAGALKGLYEGGGDRLSTVARELWDPMRPPIIALLAGRYSSEALTQLKEMLRRRAAEWCFDYRVWRWTGHEVTELAAADLRPPPPSEAYGKIAIERLIGRSRRQQPPALDELLALAEERGVGGLFALAIDEARRLGYRIKPYRGNVALRRRSPSTSKWETVIGFYIDASTAEEGLNTGIWREILGLDASDLPGRAAPRAGFMNTNRYLTSRDEITWLLEMFARDNRSGIGRTG